VIGVYKERRPERDVDEHTIEELSELITAILHYKRSGAVEDLDHAIEEAFDAQILIFYWLREHAVAHPDLFDRCEKSKEKARERGTRDSVDVVQMMVSLLCDDPRYLEFYRERCKRERGGNHER
jgi:NTP pyrophosphatase (non-canonical NTP hydrolase)